MTKPIDQLRNERGKPAMFDRNTGEVHGSGSGAGGEGNPDEDYDSDSMAGAGAEPHAPPPDDADPPAQRDERIGNHP